MARLQQSFILVLTLLLGVLPAALGQSPPPATPGLYDRPVLVIDSGMHTAMIRRADTDSAGRWAVTASDDKTVRVWSLADGALLRTIRLPAGSGDIGKVYAVAISPDGALIAVGGWTRWTKADQREQIYLFDRVSGSMIRRIDGVQGVVHHLVFSPNGRNLAAVLGPQGLRIYACEGDWPEIARDITYGSYRASFALDGRLATTGTDGKVRLYGGEFKGALQPIAAIVAPGGRPQGLAFRPDGSRLAVGYAEATVVDLLDGHTLAPSQHPNMDGIVGSLGNVAWSRDGWTLFAAGRASDMTTLATTARGLTTTPFRKDLNPSDCRVAGDGFASDGGFCLE